MSTTLSEADSKAMLSGFGVPLAPERLVGSADEAVAASVELGLPVVAKLCGDNVSHKTERGLVKLGLSDSAAVASATEELLRAARPEDGTTGVLLAPMVGGNRELIAGLSTDPQFGRTVLVGIGGILAEAVADVSVRLVPISEVDAIEMIEDLASQSLLGEFRGEPAVDRHALANVLLGLSAAAEAHPEIVSADLNPLIVHDGSPIAVDALVEVRDDRDERIGGDSVMSDITAFDLARFESLFNPRGVVIAGASSHPGKFGFVSLHNLLACGYQGNVFATNLEGGSVLGIQTVTSVDELPDGSADLIFVCTPKSANPDLLRAAAAKGITAAFLTSAGYGEAGEQGRADEDDLVSLCAELGILLVGPNGQGVVSTPANLCAQIVAPNPPPGTIGVASQSGNFVSSFMNWACATGVGISRAVSAGNAAATTVTDFLRYYAADSSTSVALAYMEGISDGRAVARGLREVAEAMPVVVMKGGATSGGARAAASHTGSLATDDRTFDGVCRQTGVTRASTIEEAFEAAATFATQPLPRGTGSS